MVRWTEEMLKEIKETKSVSRFAKENGISYSTAKRKQDELLGVVSKKVEKLKEVEEDNVNTTEISIIPSIILDIDSLIKNGVQFYLVEQGKKLSEIDKSISDIEHVLELQSDELNNSDLATFGKNIGILRKKRRLYKNEKEFLDKFRMECGQFIKFIKELKSYSQTVCDKKYNTRVLKEELGKVHITNENNSELLTLRDRVKELESKPTIDINIEDSMLRLEKFRVKQQRKNDRESGRVVHVDKLDSGWVNMFSQLDDITRNEILTEAYKEYTSRDRCVNLKTVKDYIVWNEILPKMLYDKKYFLKK